MKEVRIRLLLEALKETGYRDQVDGQGEMMMGEMMKEEMKEKGDDETYISAFIGSPSASDFELPRICMLERMFTD